MGILLFFLPVGLVTMILVAVFANRYAEQQIQNHPATQAYREAVARRDAWGAMEARREMNRAMTPHSNRVIYVVVGIIVAIFWILTMIGSEP